VRVVAIVSRTDAVTTSPAVGEMRCGHRRGPVAPASPWQNPFVERVIGSIRRECLDHVIVLNETHLRHVLRSYLPYYHRTRTHLGLDKEIPERRPVAERSVGPIIAVPEVGGLHHRYERRAA
jgi:putative transposase